MHVVCHHNPGRRVFRRVRRELQERVEADIGRIDVLINNAGVCIGRECAVGNVDYDAWTRSFNTNVMGSMRVLEHCLPHLHFRRDAS